MIVEHRGKKPKIHENTYIASNAVISGDVTIREGTVVSFGAVIIAESGPVRIGLHCVIMENAVIRGVQKHPVDIGDRVLVGPHAHLSGCTVGEDTFLATGTSIFNGAQLGKGVTVKINGVVHIKATLAPGTIVPIGWVAVGDPAELYSSDKNDIIWPKMKKLNFPKTVWGTNRSVTQGENTERYAKALLRHLNDR